MEPVRTKGNWFVRGDERFFVLGVDYHRFHSAHGDGNPRPVDVLSQAELGTLRKDVKQFTRLGINTILVRYIDPRNRHDQAFRLLAENGIYVVITVLRPDESGPGGKRIRGIFEHEFDEDFETSRFYSSELVLSMLKVIHCTMQHPNVLGYSVNGSICSMPRSSKFAEMVRAAVRDAKRFLALSEQRDIPVGVAISGNIAMMFNNVLEYFTAGSRDERVDYVSFSNYSWSGPSNFQMSGWKNLVENRLRKVPAPMFLSEYGTAIVTPRTFGETLCLLSPDCTGELSGGCVYAFRTAKEDFSLMGIEGRSNVPRLDFAYLRRRLRQIAMRSRDDVYVAEMKEYATWKGEFPEIKRDAGTRTWLASADSPPTPDSWESLRESAAT